MENNSNSKNLPGIELFEVSLKKSLTATNDQKRRTGTQNKTVNLTNCSARFDVKRYYDYNEPFFVPTRQSLAHISMHISVCLYNERTFFSSARHGLDTHSLLSHRNFFKNEPRRKVHETESNFLYKPWTKV